MDPTTAIITALVAGATAAAKDTASEVVKDLYKSLKELVSKHLTTLPRLEKNPTDSAQKAAAEELSETEIKDDPRVARAAAQLSDALIASTQPGSAIAVELKRVKATLQIVIEGNVGPVHATDVETQSFVVRNNSQGN